MSLGDATEATDDAVRRFAGRLQQIDELHQPRRRSHDGFTEVWCIECRQDWPCPTYRVSTGDVDTLVFVPQDGEVMWKKQSKERTMQRLDQALANAKQIRDLADWLSDARVTELHRRAEHAARDGYSSGASGVAVAGGDVSDPTSAYVLGRVPTDPVGTWLTEGFAMLAEGAGISVGLLARFSEALRAPEPEATTRTGAGTCQACGDYCSGAADDRLRSAYCDPCRKAWERQGRPDRGQFERDRKARGAAA